MQDKDGSVTKFVWALVIAVFIIVAVMAMYKALHSKVNAKPSPELPATQNEPAGTIQPLPSIEPSKNSEEVNEQEDNKVPQSSPEPYEDPVEEQA